MGSGGSGGFPGGYARYAPDRGEDISHNLNVSLQDLYNGKVLKVAINKDKLCESCNGRGTKEGAAPDSCIMCEGRGIGAMKKQGNSYVQCHCGRATHRCPLCKGEGRYCA